MGNELGVVLEYRLFQDSHTLIGKFPGGGHQRGSGDQSWMLAFFQRGSEDKRVCKGGEGDQTNAVREGGAGQRINRGGTEHSPFHSEQLFASPLSTTHPHFLSSAAFPFFSRVVRVKKKAFTDVTIVLHLKRQHFYPHKQKLKEIVDHV